MMKAGSFDPTDIITHKVALEDVAETYSVFGKNEEGSIKTIFNINE